MSLVSRFFFVRGTGVLTVAGEAMIARLRTGQMRTKGIQLGITTEAGIEDMIKGWQEWMEAKDATFGITSGEVIVKKP